MKKILTFVAVSTTAFALHADYKNGDSRGNYPPGQQYQGQSQQQPIQGRGYSGSYETTAPSNQSGQYRSYQGQGSSQQYGATSDQALSSKVQSTLSGSKYSNITATVKNGVVTLQGDVGSLEEKVSLGALVGGIDGVQSVNNQVTVQGQMIQGSTYKQQGYGSPQQGGSSQYYNNTPQSYSDSGSSYQNGSNEHYNSAPSHHGDYQSPQQGSRGINPTTGYPTPPSKY